MWGRERIKKQQQQSRIGPGLGSWCCLDKKIPKSIVVYLDEDKSFYFRHFEFEVFFGILRGNLNT